MTDHVNSVSRPWRRFLRFSVRGMIVLVLIVGVWLGLLVRSAHIQRDAVTAIRRSGGSVNYDWEWSNGKSIVGGKPWAPRWFADPIGVDYFGHVTYVWLSFSSAATDEAIVQVERLTRLQQLSVFQSSLSDVGLAHLTGLTNLKRLDLGGVQVTDAGLAHLKGLTSLSYLDLGYSPVSDAGLAHVKGLTNLQGLDLRGTKVTDAGLAHVKGLTNLSSLGLGRTQISDAGLTHLKGLTNLSQLDLSRTQVTDACVKDLQQALPSLTITR
jgi:internalin A